MLVLFILAYHLPHRRNLDVHTDRYSTGRDANVYVHVGLGSVGIFALESEFSMRMQHHFNYTQNTNATSLSIYSYANNFQIVFLTPAAARKSISKFAHMYTAYTTAASDANVLSSSAYILLVNMPAARPHAGVRNASRIVAIPRVCTTFTKNSVAAPNVRITRPRGSA